MEVGVGMSKTKIPWTDESLNPIGLVGGGHGCTKVSPGCDNCYAETFNHRLPHLFNLTYPTYPYDGRKREYELRKHILEQPLKWRKPRMVFVCTMMDLFHKDVPDWMIDRVFEMMNKCPQHTFQLLTKRPKRMLKYYVENIINDAPLIHYSNISYGVSVEDQKRADINIPILLLIPNVRQFISFEPLLGEILNLDEYLNKIDWVIIGCETGRNRRPCHLEWVYNLVEQFHDRYIIKKTANVGITGSEHSPIPIFIKKLEINGKVTGNVEDWPEDLRKFRQFPEVR